MKILVTGGAGFLGSHLCEELLKQGHFVYCLDNLSTGRIENISDFLELDNFELVNADVSVPINLDVEQIYNLACPASPPKYQNDPIGTTKTNVMGAINVLELAEKCSATVLQASTSEIYGDPDVHPQTERYWGRVNPIGIRSCYDEGKRCAETLFFDYHRQRNIKIKVARIFNTYGPRMHPSDGRVISNLMMQALSNNPITVYGDGQQTRSFCYVDDLIGGLIKLMNSDAEVTGPVNLGNPIEFTILELTQLILKICESNSTLEFLALPSDDPRQRQPDIEKAMSVLGWIPKISLEEGLLKSIDYYRKINH
jgi:UDP-glucuronate decarboxylase